MNPHIPHHKVVMVPHASIISKSKVSITILCLLCSPCYTAVWIKNCSKSTSVIKVATMKNTMGPCAPVIIWSWSIHCPSLSAMFDSIHNNTNQELFEKHLCNHGSHYEKYRRFFVMQRKPSCATTKLTLFTVSKYEWNTKEDTGMSLKNTLHVLWYAKRHLLGWSDIEQWKNQARSLSHYWVTLVWRHQLVSAENSVK